MAITSISCESITIQVTDEEHDRRAIVEVRPWTDDDGKHWWYDVVLKEGVPGNLELEEEGIPVLIAALQKAQEFINKAKAE